MKNTQRHTIENSEFEYTADPVIFNFVNQFWQQNLFNSEINFEMFHV